jgi:carbohydrate-binding DOMON domain-containing protein
MGELAAEYAEKSSSRMISEGTAAIARVAASFLPKRWTKTKTATLTKTRSQVTRAEPLLQLF